MFLTSVTLSQVLKPFCPNLPAAWRPHTLNSLYLLPIEFPLLHSEASQQCAEGLVPLIVVHVIIFCQCSTYFNKLTIPDP